jgi:hypothetical protein
MYPETIRYLIVALFLGLGCASSATVPAGGPGESHQSTVDSPWPLAYDRQEEHFQNMFQELWEQWRHDPQLIEARELANVAEEFYLVAEYETAMEILRQAILLLEEKRGRE